jgi:putative transposase
MPEYRRVKIPGGTYFLTLVTYQRQRLFSTRKVCDLWHEAVNHVSTYHPFTMVAYCILPDHIHMIWRMPKDDLNYSMRIGEIKKYFSKRYVARFGVTIPKNKSQQKRRELTIWQRRFWEHYINNQDDLRCHIDYIHYNPVKHGWVDQVFKWQSSSFFDYVAKGYYGLDWGKGIKLNKPTDYYGE